MSRNLYTIAVVSPDLESRLREVLVAGDVETVIQVEADLRDALDGTEPKVAFYRALLDGWNGTHRDLKLASGISIDKPWWDQLDDNGYAWPTAQSLLVRVDDSPSNPGHYAVVALLGALEGAREFVVATRCACLVLWRCVGPSFDDRDFC